MTDLGLLADEVTASERTLRRGVECGLIQAQRLGPRRLAIPASEQRYVRAYWPVLSRLRQALRSERNVRMAVLFGSVARGTDHLNSDLDILVSLEDEHVARVADLRIRLSEALGRPVQVVRLSAALRSPILLADILTDGRVLIDRDGEWPDLRDGEARVHRQAARARRDLLRDAARAVESLTSG